MQLDKREQLLLSFFRKNARQALTKISKETGVPVSTIFDKLRKYESSVISRHTALLDFQKLGFATRAKIFLKTSPQRRDSLGDHLRLHPNINTAYRVNNGFDFLVEAVFHTIQDLEQFMEHLELDYEVVHKEVYFIIDEISRESFMSSPMLLDM